MTRPFRNLSLLFLPALLTACTTANYIQAKVPPWSDGRSGPTAPPAIDARAKAFEIPQGQSLLYVLKPGPKELGVRVEVFVDGVDIGSLSKNQYVFTLVTPGTHRLKTTAQERFEKRTLLETNVRWIGVRVAEIEFIAQPNTLYIFEQVYRPGKGSNYRDFTLRQVPLSEGKEMVRAMILSKFNKYWFEEITHGRQWSASEEPCVNGETHLKRQRDIICIYK